MQVDRPSRGMDRLKTTWMEVVTIDHKMCNLYEDLTRDRLKWRSSFDVADLIIVGTRL